MSQNCQEVILPSPPETESDYPPPPWSNYSSKETEEERLEATRESEPWVPHLEGG